jgi:sarcosine oxidase gamma subunit
MQKGRKTVTCVTGGGWRRFLAKGCAYVLQLSAFPLMFVRFEAGGLYP